MLRRGAEKRRQNGASAGAECGNACFAHIRVYGLVVGLIGNVLALLGGKAYAYAQGLLLAAKRQAGVVKAAALPQAHAALVYAD